jgi:hypothetical protein
VNNIKLRLEMINVNKIIVCPGKCKSIVQSIVQTAFATGGREFSSCFLTNCQIFLLAIIRSTPTPPPQSRKHVRLYYWKFRIQKPFPQKMNYENKTNLLLSPTSVPTAQVD